MGHPIISAMCLRKRQDNEEERESNIRRMLSRVFRTRNRADKYAGNCKTKGP